MLAAITLSLGSLESLLILLGFLLLLEFLLLFLLHAVHVLFVDFSQIHIEGEVVVVVVIESLEVILS